MKERDRLREPEARILVLRIAAARPNREAETTTIKKHVPEYVRLPPEDLKPSKARHAEQIWQQIVGNVISRKNGATSIFSMGYAERLPNGIRVTDAGVAYLATLGF
jgi:hypothetical protein